ncbi:MAG: 2-dehydro-3-deoxygalactonokinase [Chitinophagaceae bacterium]
MKNKFLSCDWGTSSLRLRLIDVDSGDSITASAGDEGIASVYALWKKAGKAASERTRFYFSVIKRHIDIIEQAAGGSAENIPIIISGMASSTIGMLELPYTVLPFSLSGEDLQFKRIEKGAGAGELVIISGARTDTDVMRGEETQLIGCPGADAAGTQVFIFTGTHSKHITTAGGKAIDIATYMTGEFFELLAKKSILSDSVEAGASMESDENKAAFKKGVMDSLQQNLLHNSFLVRTNQLFKRFSRQENYFYLSGLLIGTELGGLLKKDMDAITIVGDEKLLYSYRLALKLLGITVKIQTADATAATIQGQLALYKKIYQ